jgi:hypothetical protein
MKSILTTCTLFLLGLLAPAVASAQMDGPFQCLATSTDGGHVTMYLSQMIPSGGAAPSAAMNSAWGDFVKAAYKVQNLASAVCRQMPSDPAMQQRVQDAYQRAASRGSMQLVNVNWTPGQNRKQEQNPDTNPFATTGGGDQGGGKDAPPPADNQNAAPAQDQGPQPRASYCFSDQKKPTVYVSDAFDTADIQNPDDWVNAFIKMLVDKYKYKGSVNCNDTDTIFNAQNAIRDLKDTLNGKQVIDTEWTYEAPPPGTAPAADASAAPASPPKKKTTAKTTAPKPAPQN